MVAATDSARDSAYWLALARAPGLGAAGARALLERFRTPRAAFEADERALAGLGLELATRDYLRDPDWSAVRRDLEWLAQSDCRLLTLEDDAYPARLREIADPPPLLFARGDVEALSLPQLAVVGSRNPTPAGRETAFAFAKALAEAGLIITSGLAFGVDAAAHRGALAGGGLTVAVAGHGLDQVYPREHRELAAQVAAGGVLVSEFPTGVPPLPPHFPRRNRIMSGLSLGVLVVEAARRSGSLITARRALAQGREVLAIPGSIHNPLARGCHALIREGGKLVETVDDVLEEIGPQIESPPIESRKNRKQRRSADETPPEPELDDDYRRLLEYLGYDAVSVDTLVERSGLTPEAVSSMLLILELQGYVSSLSGGLYVRATQRR